MAEKKIDMLHGDCKAGPVRCEDIRIVVIIPLYDGVLYIHQAIESVLHQRLPPTEIIVVDDGSTECGPRVVEKLAWEHPIRLFHKPNGGQGSARNFGIANSGCDLIALLDRHDVWYCNQWLDPTKSISAIARELGWKRSTVILRATYLALPEAARPATRERVHHADAAPI
jgi:glycosyltransferase involved in cell wall biosynthesis